MYTKQEKNLEDTPSKLLDMEKQMVFPGGELLTHGTQLGVTMDFSKSNKEIAESILNAMLVILEKI